MLTRTNDKRLENYMTFTTIQEAALKRFGEQGFHGTSLSQIAADVGIKPPSIYAHFESKEELFLSLVEPTIEKELAYAREFFKTPLTNETLFDFLKDIGRRFEKAPMRRFLLHLAYLPPQPLIVQTDKPVKRYMNSLDRLMLQTFRQLPAGRLTLEEMASSYIGIVDSLQAEILYGGKRRFQKRLSALWALFRLALS
ncbi:TetR/AcrR family transcriptional regulator [Deltaproteobacteria bacterium Smac51]|nr:TetR/AcrR family transcriptional regulator [Deltaproteobacteria bacterium Smac51]